MAESVWRSARCAGCFSTLPNLLKPDLPGIGVIHGEALVLQAVFDRLRQSEVRRLRSCDAEANPAGAE